MGRTKLIDEDFTNLNDWTVGTDGFVINPAGQLECELEDNGNWFGLYHKTLNIIPGRSYYIEWECTYFSAEEPVDNSEGRFCLGKQLYDGELFSAAESGSATIIAGDVGGEFQAGPDFRIGGMRYIDFGQGYDVVFRLTSLKLYIDDVYIAMST